MYVYFFSVVVAVTTFDDEEPEQEYVVEQEEPVNPFKNVNFANVPQYKYKPPNNQVHYVRPMQKPPQINYKPVQGYRRLPNKAEERKIKFVKMIKKKKKKKYKKLKKYLKNCGYPNHFKFKATKHADDEGDEYDTVKIGFMNDDHYYRRMMRRDDKGNVTKTDEKEKNSSEEGDDEDDEDDDVIFEELEDELEDKKPSPIPMFHPLMPRPYFPMNPMMPHQFPRPMFPPGPPPPPPPPPGFSMYRPRYPPPKPLGPAPIMRHPNLPLPHLPPQMPHTHQQMPLPHAQMVPHTQMVHPPPHMVPFGPPRVLPRPTIWKNQLKKRIPLTNPDLVSEETIVEEKIKDNKVRKPVVRIRPVQRAQFEVRNSTDELTTIITSPKTIYITTSAPLGYGLDKSSNSKYETFKFSYGFSPSHTAFSNPNTYNIKYSQPDYSMFGTYESTTTMKPTEPEKVVTVTPVSVWEGQPIFAAETTTTTKTVSNNTRKMHLRRMQKPDDRKDTEEETTHSWVPLRIKPTSKMSSRFKKSENFVTYPTVDRQQVSQIFTSCIGMYSKSGKCFFNV